MASDVWSAVLVDGTRSEVWDALISTAGAQAFFAPDAEVELQVGGRYDLGGDGGGEILSFSHEQEIVIALETPKRLGGGTTRVHFALEPVDVSRVRVVVIHEFLDDTVAERLRDHCAESWSWVLERFRLHMAMAQPAMEHYAPFWADA